MTTNYIPFIRVSGTDKSRFLIACDYGGRVSQGEAGNERVLSFSEGKESSKVSVMMTILL